MFALMNALMGQGAGSDPVPRQPPAQTSPPGMPYVRTAPYNPPPPADMWTVPGKPHVGTAPYNPFRQGGYYPPAQGSMNMQIHGLAGPQENQSSQGLSAADVSANDLMPGSPQQMPTASISLPPGKPVARPSVATLAAALRAGPRPFAPSPPPPSMYGD